jgi:hypothetical protein
MRSVRIKNIIGRFLRGGAVFFLALFLTSFSPESKPAFSSERLKRIFGMLNEESRKNIENAGSAGQGTHFIKTNINGIEYKIVFRINYLNEFEHLGIFLIKDSLDLPPVREVFDYIEREFLVSAILGDRYPLISESKNDKIDLYYNGRKLKSEQKLLNVSKISIDQNTPFRINYDSDFFMIEWKLNFSNKFGIKIPNNYSFITGETKDELELDLLRKVKSLNSFNVFKSRPTRDQLRTYGTNIYIQKGNIFDKTPGITSDRFFAINDSIHPVFNKLNYLESICDLFLNLVPTSKMLEVTQKLYGGSEEKFRINLNSFYTAFSRNYIIYFGWQSIDRDGLKASIIISNTIYNFNHLLIISSSVKNIFENTDDIKALFYAYIPNYNLKKSIY